MTKTQLQRENAHRIAETLSDCANNGAIVQRMAALLNYNAEQLAQDMQAVYAYIRAQERQGGE